MKKLLTILSFIIITTAALAADKYISSSGDLVLKTAVTKKVNLNSTLYTTQDGKVGVGLASPTYTFDVYTNQASFGGMRIFNDSSDGAAKGGIGLGDHNGSLQNQIYTNAAGKLFIDNIYTNGMEIRANTSSSPVTAVAVDSAGKVGIGTASPSNKLELYEGIFEIEHTGGTDRFFDFKQFSGWNLRLIGRSTSTYIGIDSVEGTGGTTGRTLKINPAGGDVTIGGTYRLDKGTANPTHINDFICTTSIPGSSSENIFSITFSNTSAHTGSARVLITSDGESGGTGFGSRIRELHLNWIQGTAVGVTSLHDTNIGAAPSISYTVATNVITFFATATSNTSHFCHSIEIQGQTGVYGQYGLGYTRYGD